MLKRLAKRALSRAKESALMVMERVLRLAHRTNASGNNQSQR